MQHQSAVEASLQDMVDSARAVRGESFAQAAALMCEAMQANSILARMKVDTDARTDEAFDSVAGLISRSTARALDLVGMGDQLTAEATTLAKRMHSTISGKKT